MKREKERDNISWLSISRLGVWGLQKIRGGAGWGNSVFSLRHKSQRYLLHTGVDISVPHCRPLQLRAWKSQVEIGDINFVVIGDNTRRKKRKQGS